MTPEKPYWFLFYKNDLLLLCPDGPESNQTLTVPRQAPAEAEDSPFLTLPLGQYGETPCFARAVSEMPDNAPPGLHYIRSNMRGDVYDALGPALYKIAGLGRQLAYWDTHSQFCPACAAKTSRLSASFSKTCPDCGFSMHTPIFVAIMVAIIKHNAVGEDEILLIRGRNAPGSYHALVAGFLEPGENLEECVAREVMEETGIRIKNIRYFTSQTWPIISNLMVGFYAEYDGGEIKIQESELSAAAFYRRDALPEIPHRFSLTHQLITWWAEGNELPK